MMIPTVHNNGTSRDVLQIQLRNAIDALQQALKAMREAAPNGRDYYPQDIDFVETALDIAHREHRDRVKRVTSVLGEYKMIHEAMIDRYEF